MRLSLVGGTGALGSILHERFTLEGHDVSVWGRSSPRALDVMAPSADDDPVDADSIVYLAWATSNRSPDAQQGHVEAAGHWARRAAELGNRFLFVSTVLASADARSAYGRAKFAAEDRLREFGALSLRVGLVVDDGYPGLLATRLRKLASRAPVTRRAAAWPVYPVSGSAVAAAILAEATESGHESQAVWVASEEPTPLAQVLGAHPDVEPSQTLRRAVDAIAHIIPPVVGPLGRYGDALRGLTQPERAVDGTRPPLNGPIPRGDWREGTGPGSL